MFKNSFRVTALFFLFISISHLQGCSGAFTDEDIARKVIAKYTAALGPAYRIGDFKALGDVAAYKAFSDIDNSYSAYKNGNGIVLNANLIEMEFKDIVIGSGVDDVKVRVEYVEEDKEWVEVYLVKETVVKTTELWNYMWLDYKTQVPRSPDYTVRYDITYKLDYVGKDLKIIGTSISSETVVSKKDTGALWDNQRALPMSPH